MASKLGHDCLVASDGSAAWELLSAATSTCSADRLDDAGTWTGPNCVGACATRLKDDYTYIVLVTGAGRPEQILEGMSAGADDYIDQAREPLDVQTCLVAAERVTCCTASSQVRAQLEEANLECWAGSR